MLQVAFTINLNVYEDNNESSDIISKKLLVNIESASLAYGADTSSVNYGNYCFVFINLGEKKSLMFIANCHCHILHNIARQACKNVVIRCGKCHYNII